MEIRQLRYFVALAETLHFGRAAERLHITQPPLSRQIAALEDELGTVLFARSSRSVALTPAGVDFYGHATRLLYGLDLAAHSARATALGERGELRLGFTMYAAWNVLPGVIKRFSQSHPYVFLRLSEAVPQSLQEALEQGRADVGISFPLHVTGALRYQPLYREPLCAVLPHDHALAGRSCISAGDLTGEQFVTFPRETAPALHEVVMACCREYGFQPNIRLETHLQQTIVNLVAEGLGVSLVPDSMRRMQLSGAVFRSLEHSPMIEQGIYWNEHNANPCREGFMTCALTVARGLDQAHGPGR